MNADEKIKELEKYINNALKDVRERLKMKEYASASRTIGRINSRIRGLMDMVEELKLQQLRDSL